MNHIPAKQSDITPYVLLPGDPSRVDKIGEYLESFEVIGQRREYRLGKGLYQGVPVTVVSTGIGCPSTAIAVEELIEAGAQYLMRVGTCGGSWRKDIPSGSLVVPTACVRNEGTTQEYIPLGFPAVASIDVVNALSDAAKTLNKRCFVGINRTHDSFYGTQDVIVRWGRYLAEDRFKGVDTPILSSEMEAAALFVIASLRNVSAGAVLAVNSDPESLKDRVLGSFLETAVESSSRITKKTVDAAIQTALRAFWIIECKS